MRLGMAVAGRQSAIVCAAAQVNVDLRVFTNTAQPIIKSDRAQARPLALCDTKELGLSQSAATR